VCREGLGCFDGGSEARGREFTAVATMAARRTLGRTRMIDDALL
jgi:hypothetical protein